MIGDREVRGKRRQCIEVGNEPFKLLQRATRIGNVSTLRVSWFFKLYSSIGWPITASRALLDKLQNNDAFYPHVGRKVIGCSESFWRTISAETIDPVCSPSKFVQEICAPLQLVLCPYTRRGCGLRATLSLKMRFPIPGTVEQTFEHRGPRSAYCQSLLQLVGWSDCRKMKRRWQSVQRRRSSKKGPERASLVSFFKFPSANTTNIGHRNRGIFCEKDHFLVLRAVRLLRYRRFGRTRKFIRRR